MVKARSLASEYELTKKQAVKGAGRSDTSRREAHIATQGLLIGGFHDLQVGVAQENILTHAVNVLHTGSGLNDTTFAAAKRSLSNVNGSESGSEKKTFYGNWHFLYKINARFKMNSHQNVFHVVEDNLKGSEIRFRC
ncbi:hypothetical protein TCAL_16444 [Tigriopus californicus]|uniref:Uncharacterized protein n=1 Tax=Tigriopus californicus TaxID=6832 RepID=A0A553NYL6_TIGCA|nr:hypothetical protein TCAL_16444 [Tigriopus californicus]